MAVGQNPVPLVNIKIGGTWVFIRTKMKALVLTHTHVSSRGTEVEAFERCLALARLAAPSSEPGSPAADPCLGGWGGCLGGVGWVARGMPWLGGGGDVGWLGVRLVFPQIAEGYGVLASNKEGK